MKLVEFSLNNKITVLFFLFVIFVGGVGAYFKLGKLEDPDFTIKTALIVTTYPGASVHEVEQEVTRKIEEAVQAADEVERIRSESRAGISRVYVDLYERVGPGNIQQLWDMVRRKVESVQKDLPQGAMPSQVYDDYGDVFGMFLALTGDGLELNELKKYAKYMKRELLLVEDVEKIELFGEQQETISIYVNPAKSAALGIHPSKITDIIRDQNRILVCGKFETGSKRIRIYQSGVFKSLDDIKNLIIQADPKSQVLLKDIAEVKRDYSDPPGALMRFNGSPAIGIGISVKPDANVVDIGESVRQKMDSLLETLPLGASVDGIYYQSEFVKGAIKKFMTNLVESVGIVIIVLLVSMGVRSGFIIASNLLLTILGTFVVMIIMGIHLQKISLSALILVMGMIVDNAIVVAEGSLTMLQAGRKRSDSCLIPPSQTAFPLLGATVIAGLAFMPIYFAPNNVGEFMESLALVVGISLLISWVLSMTQTPVFCHYLLNVTEKEKNRGVHDGLLYRTYKRMLYFALTKRAVTLVLVVVLLFSGVVAFKHVKKNFFADSDKKQFFVDYRRTEGATIQSVSEDIKKFECYLRQKEGVVNYASCLGQGAPRFAASLTPKPPNPSFAQVIINVSDYKYIDDMANEITGWFHENLPEGEPHVWKYLAGPKANYRVEARITGRDPKVLRDISAEIEAIMRKNPQATSVTNDWKERVMAVELGYSQSRARKGGVEREDISLATRAATDGVTVSNFREADELLPVKFRFVGITPGNIDGLPVWGHSSTAIPLLQVCNDAEVTWEDPVIRRYNRKRVIRTQCDPVTGVTSNTLLAQIRPQVEKIKLPEGYGIEWQGEFELSMRGNKGVRKYLPVCLLVMVLILVLLFNSVRQPLIIMFTLPFAIIGIAAGLLLMDKPFGFLAILGTYSLMGMLIKNAVVLIDEINIKIETGLRPFAAIESAGINRVRPVLLTSLTTILGMIPLLNDPRFGSMAVTIMFGLLIATFLTLLMVPLLYTLFYNIKPHEKEVV